MSTMGYITLHRKLANHPIWLMEPFTYGQAWADLLMLANHKDGFIKVRGIVLPVKRGQVGWSALTLSGRWKWSRGKTLRYFSFLAQQNMIIIEQQNNKLSSIITIIKYNEYQLSGTTNDTTEQDIRRATDVQQTDTNKKDKKGKKDKTDNPVAVELYEYYIKMLDPERKTYGRAIENITYWLANGFTSDKLQLSINIYSQKHPDPHYTKDPANFFGKEDQTFKGYIQDKQNTSEQIVWQ